MKGKFSNIKVIGLLLTILYALSLIGFIFYIKIPELQLKSTIYVVLFSFLFIGSVAVARLKEWGRKVIVSINDWKRVLIIDDNIMLIKIIRPILMSNGFSVLSASSGEEGLQIARTQLPDIIVLDVILPKMNGREVCKRLKNDSQTKSIPVVFLTSKDSSDDVNAEMEAGGIIHLTKPVNAKVLISTIKNILASGA